jgi:hypothetical protein
MLSFGDGISPSSWQSFKDLRYDIIVLRHYGYGSDNRPISTHNVALTFQTIATPESRGLPVLWRLPVLEVATQRRAFKRRFLVVDCFSGNGHFLPFFPRISSAKGYKRHLTLGSERGAAGLRLGTTGGS